MTTKTQERQKSYNEERKKEKSKLTLKIIIKNVKT